MNITLQMLNWSPFSVCASRNESARLNMKTTSIMKADIDDDDPSSDKETDDNAVN